MFRDPRLPPGSRHPASSTGNASVSIATGDGGPLARTWRSNCGCCNRSRSATRCRHCRSASPTDADVAAQNRRMENRVGEAESLRAAKAPDQAGVVRTGPVALGVRVRRASHEGPGERLRGRERDVLIHRARGVGREDQGVDRPEVAARDLQRRDGERGFGGHGLGAGRQQGQRDDGKQGGAMGHDSPPPRGEPTRGPALPG